MGTLAGGIAHDFNNILAGILGYGELSLGQAKENPKLGSYLEKIMSASQRAVGLVQQILSFSRQSKQELSPVSLSPIVKEALKLIRASIPATIEVKRRINDTKALVMADQTQIHQVVMNLCTNAFHAMAENSGIMTVSLNEVFIDKDDEKKFLNLKSGRYMKLMVSDTGCGIPPDIKDKIFNPFFTTKEVGKGTGMGLSVLHGIVKSHKGDVKVYSEAGKGTSFHIYFPIIDKKGVKEAMMDMEDLPRGRERVLMVDDEKDITAVVRQNLEELGYVLVTENSALLALERFSQAPDQYDLVISDMTMPKMTGISLAEKLRAVRSDIPIIICSGLEDQSITDNVDQGRINAFLIKPFSKRTIAKLVRKVLDSERL